jgi:hypothetical protein
VLRSDVAQGHTHLLVYESCNRQAVEAVCEGPPQPDAVPPLALIIEAIDPVDGGTLVVASQQEEVFWVLDLHIPDSCRHHSLSSVSVETATPTVLL